MNSNSRVSAQQNGLYPPIPVNLTKNINATVNSTMYPTPNPYYYNSYDPNMSPYPYCTALSNQTNNFLILIFLNCSCISRLRFSG